jgi:hypothetical protein
MELLYSYLKQMKFFFQSGGQAGKTGPVWGLAPVGGRRIKGKGVGGEYGGNVMYSCMKMEK